MMRLFRRRRGGDEPRGRGGDEIRDVGLRRLSRRGITPELLQTGEEAWVFHLDEPVQSAGVEVVKVFHRNYAWVHRGNFVHRRPLFPFSHLQDGFKRRYYVHRLAHELFPEHFVDLRDLSVPRRMPYFFDEQNPPRDAIGRPCFPKFWMNYVEVPAGLRERVSAGYERSKDIQRRFEGIIQGKEVLDSGDIEKLQALHRELDRHVSAFNARERELEPSILEVAGEFESCGLFIPRPEVNYAKVGGEIVFFEVQDMIDLFKLGKTIRSRFDPERDAVAVRRVTYPLRRILELTEACYRDMFEGDLSLPESVYLMWYYGLDVHLFVMMSERDPRSGGLRVYPLSSTERGWWKEANADLLEGRIERKP